METILYSLHIHQPTNFHQPFQYLKLLLLQENSIHYPLELHNHILRSLSLLQLIERGEAGVRVLLLRVRVQVQVLGQRDVGELRGGLLGQL